MFILKEQIPTFNRLIEISKLDKFRPLRAPVFANIRCHDFPIRARVANRDNHFFEIPDHMFIQTLIPHRFLNNKVLDSQIPIQMLIPSHTSSSHHQKFALTPKTPTFIFRTLHNPSVPLIPSHIKPSSLNPFPSLHTYLPEAFAAHEQRKPHFETLHCTLFGALRSVELGFAWFFGGIFDCFLWRLRSFVFFHCSVAVGDRMKKRREVKELSAVWWMLILELRAKGWDVWFMIEAPGLWRCSQAPGFCACALKL